MTDKVITREQFEAFRYALFIGDDERLVRALNDKLGITIADPDPPEAMVQKAREFAASLYDPHDRDGAWTVGPILTGGKDDHPAVQAALAALQYFEKLVKDAQNGAGSVEDGALGFILTAIGSNRHD